MIATPEKEAVGSLSVFGVCRVCGESLQQYATMSVGCNPLQFEQQTGARFLLAVRTHFVENHRDLVIVPETMSAFLGASLYASAVNAGPVSAALIAGAVDSIRRDAEAVHFDALQRGFDASAMGKADAAVVEPVR